MVGWRTEDRNCGEAQGNTRVHGFAVEPSAGRVMQA